MDFEEQSAFSGNSWPISGIVSSLDQGGLVILGQVYPPPPLQILGSRVSKGFLAKTKETLARGGVRQEGQCWQRDWACFVEHGGRPSETVYHQGVSNYLKLLEMKVTGGER